jgi:hypothetical protein
MGLFCAGSDRELKAVGLCNLESGSGLLGENGGPFRVVRKAVASHAYFVNDPFHFRTLFPIGNGIGEISHPGRDASQDSTPVIRCLAPLPGCGIILVRGTGGVARASLNHRLLAVILPGSCGADAFGKEGDLRMAVRRSPTEVG